MNRQILLRWERHADKRYYLIMLYRDLLGDLVLTKVWGGIGKANGNQYHIPVTSESEGLALIDQVIKRRRQRGYDLVNGLADIQAFANAA
jgi:hypothetical protein